MSRSSFNAPIESAHRLEHTAQFAARLAAAGYLSTAPTPLKGHNLQVSADRAAWQRRSPWTRLCKNRVRNRLSAGGESHERTRLGSGFRSSQKSESDFQRFLDDSGLGKRGFARKINAVRWTSLGCRLENGPLFPGRRPTKRLVLCIFFECAFGRGGSFSRPIK